MITHYSWIQFYFVFRIFFLGDGNRDLNAVYSRKSNTNYNIALYGLY